MRIFTQQKEHTTTRIVRRPDSAQTSVKLTVAVGKTDVTSRWEGRQEEFKGFDSPPGRF
jgi:hypothetical protein